tara:strand:+ start:358 stop:705 length:348 start_codon:yes stop_codon:yes gene_type:complete
LKEIQLLKYTDSVQADPTDKKYVVSDYVHNKLFNLLDKQTLFTSFSIGYVGGWDVEGHEGHKCLDEQMNLLDTQIKDIRSMFLSDEALEKLERDNHNNVNIISPFSKEKTGRPKK